MNTLCEYCKEKDKCVITNDKEFIYQCSEYNNKEEIK